MSVLDLLSELILNMAEPHLQEQRFKLRMNSPYWLQLHTILINVYEH
jgi:hypothetical protein